MRWVSRAPPVLGDLHFGCPFSLPSPRSSQLAHPRPRLPPLIARRTRCPSRLIARVPRVPAALFELSNLLDTGLDRETLAILVELCESGVNPEALSKVVVELRRESEVIRASQMAE